MATRSLLLLVAVGPTQPLLLPRRGPPPRRPRPRPCLCSAQHRRWDSNAETVRSRSFGFDFRRPDQNDDAEEEADEDDEEEEEGFFRSRWKKRRWWSDEVDDGPSRGILEEAIDTFWVLKVFKAYGWLLPLVLISWLLASGPKAFLMALAIPLGQSALALAFDKLWGGTKSRPKRRRSRMRRRRPATGATAAETEEEMAEEEDEDREPRKGKSGYQSWVVGNGGSVDTGGQRETGFGGWDDLEGVKSAQRSSRARAEGLGGTEKKGKLSRRERRSDTPLLLRLLVAVFPFLGSWTKMLW